MGMYKFYEDDEIAIYIAYVVEWYETHDMRGKQDAPVCIDEFYDNEMRDEEIAKYYEQLAIEMALI